MREDKKLQFRNDHFWETIVGEATRAKEKGKTGYVSLTADKDFNLKKRSVEFIEEDFDRKEFEDAQSAPINPEDVKYSEFIYYRILWEDDNTEWKQYYSE